MTAPLVVASGLSHRFGGGGILRRAPLVRAVSDFDLTIARGEAVGLVGESGSGKSTVGRLLLGLMPPSQGRVLFEGQDLAGMGGAARRRLRQRMQLIFQDPYSSLDPRRRVGVQIRDGLRIHHILPRAEQAPRVAALMAQVGVRPDTAARFPHAFSGGQRQRLAIARALATGPDFLVADEPVSALDVSIQAQVLTLLAGLRASLGLAMVFISHDLAAVRLLCDRVVVMYLGRIVEEGPVAAVFAQPAHPYTRALLSASPSLDRRRRRARIILQGELPSPTNPPSGCVFRTRCPHALPACAASIPAARAIGPGHVAACIRDDLPADAGAYPGEGPA
jgi:oligopeptide/dipeptide ABC transporter ATP-binding protein